MAKFEYEKMETKNFHSGETKNVFAVKVGNTRAEFDSEPEAMIFASELNREFEKK